MDCLPPEILRQFESLVPGSAAQLLERTSQETEFRRENERRALDANITAQSRQLAIIEQQSRAVFRSDIAGQIAGLIVCLACVGGAVYLGISHPENWQIPTALAAIPTAAIIKAFKISSHSEKERKKQ